jgi:hypothetical protein
MVIDVLFYAWMTKPHGKRDVWLFGRVFIAAFILEGALPAKYIFTIKNDFMLIM